MLHVQRLKAQFVVICGLSVCLSAVACDPASAAPKAQRPPGEQLPSAAPARAAPPAPGISPNQAGTPRERFDVFWSAFRAALERGDGEAIASLTKFPFETRGSDDSAPLRKHRRAEFAALLDKLLADDAGQLRPVSMRKLILQTTDVKGHSFAGVQARVGGFEFRDTKKGWQLVRAYTEVLEPGYAPPMAEASP